MDTITSTAVAALPTTVLVAGPAKVSLPEKGSWSSDGEVYRCFCGATTCRKVTVKVAFFPRTVSKWLVRGRCAS